jgi:hypothetical protein
MRKYKGASRVLLLPRTTQQVAAVFRHCNARRLAVVPQGGNTGLVGRGSTYTEITKTFFTSSYDIGGAGIECSPPLQRLSTPLLARKSRQTSIHLVGT